MSTKEAAKPLQECVKETETIELYFQQGSSDKVYHLQLESVEDQWSVNVAAALFKIDTKALRTSVAKEEQEKARKKAKKTAGREKPKPTAKLARK
jgi:hypothetical protein